MSIAVVRSSEPAAYSWPSGQIIVTRGLLELLDDERLAAAIAHEVGHVLTRRDHKGMVSLRGRHAGMAAELRADEVGAGLLSAAGLPPKAMASMLATVQSSANLTPQQRTDICRRIQHLEVQFGRNGRHSASPE